MTSASRPLVALICRVPIVSEALETAFDGVADVRAFPARRGDTHGLLRWLEPDAVVVDTEEEAAAATPFARAASSPLVHVRLDDGSVRLLEDDVWREANGDAATPEAIRNIVCGGIFGRGRGRSGK